MTIRLLTLGGLRGDRDGVDLDWLLSQHLRAALLTYLALERRSTRDLLQTLLWPETDASSAGHRLNQSVYELRRTLGNACIETQGRELKAGAALTADALEFEHTAESGLYERAIALYNGQFLAGVYLASTTGFQTWVDARRARYARLFRKICRAAVDARVAAADLQSALTAARAWIQADPLDDEAQHRVIELYALSGERAQALKQYESYSRLLETEGLQALDETRSLIARLERGWAGDSAAGEQRDRLAPLVELPNSRQEKRATTDQRSRWSRLGADIDSRLEAELFPDFEIIRQVGWGVMARVYLAREPALQRLVAIKVLRPELVSDATARMRFEREAHSAAKLVHAHITAVHRIGQLSDGTPFLVMEYVDGRNLADKLTSDGSFSEAEACGLLAQLAAALAAAHRRGIIHRDLKPANVMLAREGDRAVLMDFGLAAVVESGTEAFSRLTATGDLIGEPAFASPEQLQQQPITTASDIFSLGLLGYHILTLKGPYDREARDPADHRSPRALTVLRPGTPPELSDLLLRCLSRNPEHRPEARELARTFGRLAAPASGERRHASGRGLAAVVERLPRLRRVLDELKRRRVYNVAILYLTVAFVGLQVADLILPAFRLSGSFDLVVAFVLAGFPVALILAWMFDISRKGIRRTPSPSSSTPGPRKTD